MVEGKKLLGYGNGQKEKKQLKYIDWLILVLGTSPLWLFLLLCLSLIVVALFLVFTIGFSAAGFILVVYFVYSGFLAFSDLWPSLIKMGASLMGIGITIMVVPAVFKGTISYFVLFKKGYLKIRDFLFLKKLEEQKNE